jgi:DNA-binding transcriptional MerR regulator
MSSDFMYAYTEDLMEAGGVSRMTITTWVREGLLPVPESVSLGGPGGHSHRWPAWAIERARFIGMKRRAGYTKPEILELLRKQGEAVGGASRGSGAKRSGRRR